MPPQYILSLKVLSFLAFSVCSVYSVVKQPVLKLGLAVTCVHYPKVEIKGIVMLSVDNHGIHWTHGKKQRPSAMRTVWLAIIKVFLRNWLTKAGFAHNPVEKTNVVKRLTHRFYRGISGYGNKTTCFLLQFWICKVLFLFVGPQEIIDFPERIHSF